MILIEQINTDKKGKKISFYLFHQCHQCSPFLIIIHFIFYY